MAKSSLARCSLTFVLVFALILAPELVSAKKGKKGNRSVVALFLSAKGKPNSKIYASLLSELTRAGKVKPVRVLYGKSLRKVIKSKPEKAIGKCGSNVACISKLGQKARANVVIYGRVSASGGGIKAQLLVVDVAGQSISERMALNLTSVADVETQIAAKLDTLFPVGGTAMAATDEIPLDMILDAPADTTGDTTETASGDELPFDFALPEPDPEPAETTVAAADPEPEPEEDLLELAPPPPPKTEIAAVNPELATTREQETASGSSRVLTYTGIGVAGLGVAALGVGGYFGMASSSTIDSIEYGRDGTTQFEALEIEEDANSQASMANLMFGVGGGLVAVGAVLVALDLFVLDGDATPSTSVSVGANAAAATFSWDF